MYIIAGLKAKILTHKRITLVNKRPLLKIRRVGSKVVRDDPDEKLDELSRSRWFGANSPGTVGFYLTLRSRPVFR